LRGVLQVSERRACSLVAADRKMIRYRSRRPPDTALRARLRELANQRRRFGYRRLFILLRADGEGRVPTAPKLQYTYSPRLDPVLRFDSNGAADKLPELLEKAKREPLTDAEARLLAEAERVQVYSPNRQHREAFASRMAKESVELVLLEGPRDVLATRDHPAFMPAARITWPTCRSRSVEGIAVLRYFKSCSGVSDYPPIFHCGILGLWHREAGAPLWANADIVTPNKPLAI